MVWDCETPPDTVVRRKRLYPNETHQAGARLPGAAAGRASSGASQARRSRASLAMIRISPRREPGGERGPADTWGAAAGAGRDPGGGGCWALRGRPNAFPHFKGGGNSNLSTSIGLQKHSPGAALPPARSIDLHPGWGPAPWEVGGGESRLCPAPRFEGAALSLVSALVSPATIPG